MHNSSVEDRHAIARPGRLRRHKPACARRDFSTLTERLLEPVQAQKGERPLAYARAHAADRLSCRRDRRRLGGQRALDADRQDTAARCAAVLHARDDLLADETSLREAHPPDLIEIGFMWKNLIRAEIMPAFGEPEPDAPFMIGQKPILRRCRAIVARAHLL